MARRRIALLPGATLALSLLLSGLFAGSVAAGGGCHAGLERDAAETSIRLIRNCFDPLLARVPTGATVTFLNGDQQTHSVTGASNTWGTYEPIAQGERAVYLFTKAGVFPYFCIIHPGMIGAVIVGDGSPGAGGSSVEHVSTGTAAAIATSAPASTSRATPAPTRDPAASAAAVAAPARPADGGGSGASSDASNAAAASPTAPTGLLIFGLLGVLLAAGAAYGFGLFPRRRPSPR